MNCKTSMNAPASGCRFIFSDRAPRRLRGRSRALLVAGAVFCGVVHGCNRPADPPANAAEQQAEVTPVFQEELEYRLLSSELALARTKEPYLVLDFDARMLQLRLGGVPVWEHPLDYAEADSESMAEFSRRFQGSEGQLVRPVLDKYLFRAGEKTPDSILAIVGRAVNVDQGLLQREIPGRFQIQWPDRLVLEIRTTAEGEPISPVQNALIEFRQLLLRPMGESVLILQMNAEHALTLYRAAHAGMPTLINPTPADFQY